MLPPVRLYLITPLGLPMETLFKWKESAPIRGRYVCLKILGIWHFWRTLALIISRSRPDIFDLFGPVDTTH